jgi:phosphoribosylamine--glycine ligase
MGAYSPAPLVDETQLRWIEQRSRQPFRGVLYAGIMMTHQGPKVLEYNVRFGDPECQPLLMRLKSDLLELLEATVDGRLEELRGIEWDPRPSVCVVMASDGYPGEYQPGQAIRGLDEAAQLPDVKVFHAGTATAGGQVVTNGGRVLGVTALGDTIAAARRQAYAAVKCIRWSGAWCRKDIADRVVTGA